MASMSRPGKHAHANAWKLGMPNSPNKRLRKSTFTSSKESFSFGFGSLNSGSSSSGDTKELRLIICEKSKRKGENSGGSMFTSTFGLPGTLGRVKIDVAIAISGIFRVGGWKLKFVILNWQTSK